MDCHAIIDATSVVVDVVLWDGQAPHDEGGWSPPTGHTAVLIPAGSGVGIGWSYDAKAGAFTAPASAAAPPSTAPRVATTYRLMKALTDAQRAAYANVKPWDQRQFSARDTPWPETNEKIGRIATVIGTNAAAWFDAALTPAAS